jgi:hypothetical protein
MAPMCPASSAASADDGDTGREKTLGVVRHVLRRTEIEDSSLHHLRKARVRLNRERKLGRRPHSLHHLEHELRADAAVRADHVHVETAQGPGHMLRFRPERRRAVVAEGHLSD